MKRRVAIIGSGQAGLLAAHGLQRAGHEVSLYSDRSADQWYDESTPTGSGVRFAEALSYERDLGLTQAHGQAPRIEGIHLNFGLAGRSPIMNLVGHLKEPALAIDLRMQSKDWMNSFAQKGGNIVIKNVDVASLDSIAKDNELTLVAAGKGELGRIFARDDARSLHAKPQRHLAMAVVTGVPLSFDDTPFRAIRFTVMGLMGECFFIPYYHKDLGPTWNLLLEARPGTPLDCFGGAKDGHTVVQLFKKIIAKFMPWHSRWAEQMQLADTHAWLVGHVTPTVRKPVGHLPSGRIVMPLGDTAMSLDPIGGQGANNGNHMARHYVHAINNRVGEAFDAAWMQATFETFYQERGRNTFAMNHLLLEPLKHPVRTLLLAQSGSDGLQESKAQLIANAIAGNLADPRTLTRAFQSGAAARAFVRKATGLPEIVYILRGFFRVVKDVVMSAFVKQRRLTS
jgi:Styrene monooxygenase A putative substrate binding domain